jgi:hypothetical protein
MVKAFSVSFSTFSDWEEQAPDTHYVKRIRRLHAFYPQASLAQLRGHPRKGERPLSQLNSKHISIVPWGLLTPQERTMRLRARQVYFLMRNEDLSLYEASRRTGLDPSTVLRHLDGFKKAGDRWVPKRYFFNEVWMEIYEAGKRLYVPIKDTRTQSLIGRYLANVRLFLETNSLQYLEPFRNVRFQDSTGQTHSFDINPFNLYLIHEMMEDAEFHEIYLEADM